MFQGAFNRALGTASGAMMAAKTLMSGMGIPNVQKQLAAQQEVNKQYEQMNKALMDKYDDLAKYVQEKREANLRSLSKARAAKAAKREASNG